MLLWLLLTRILLVASLAAWWCKKPSGTGISSSFLQTLLLYIATVVTFYVVSPAFATLFFAHTWHYSRELAWYFHLDELLLRHASMLVTFAAVAWLLNRTWQTLWKPTSDLISILGVDVPEPPDVSLAGIRADAATLNWTRPSSNRPVQKFLIQVNGVNVGESRPEETAITVTGLRPNHCYNIRVIAVGPNNFQAGSQVIRLRTYQANGRPELGNSRVPDSFQDQDAKVAQSQGLDDASGKSQLPSIEAAPSIDGVPPPSRDGSSTVPGQRRNTIGRRHSPSVASQDQPAFRMPPKSGQPEPSLKELADTLEKIRKEIDETLAQYSQEEADFKRLEQSMKKDKEKKKQMLKEKDDQTAQLKQKVKSTYEQMRSMTKEKAKKENELKAKQDKRKKIHETVDKCTTDLGKMKKARDGFANEKDSLQQDRDLKVKHLTEENAALQEECTQLEAEYKEKKDQLKELEDERKQLPGGEDDDKWKEDDRRMRRDFDMRRRELQSQLIMETRRAQQFEHHIHVLHTQIYTQQQSGLQLYQQANASGVDFDQNAPAQVKRRSRASNSSIPSGPPTNSTPSHFVNSDAVFATAEAIFGPPGGARSTFAPGPFMDMSNPEPESFHAEMGFSEADIRALTGGAPLSPTATALLPSGILMDDDPPSPIFHRRQSPAGPDDEFNSPASSGRISLVSSPHNSSYNLPFALHHVDSNDHRSLNDVGSSPGGPPPAASHRFSNLLASFNRSRGVKSPEDENGPVLGTLKHGQSQSFPRQTDDPDSNKRRISFTSNWFNRSNGNPESNEGNMLHSSSSRFSAKRLNPFASSSGLFAERMPSSPRPASIASAELPRPSTDSGSIWGAPGDNFSRSRIWSPEANMWPSRNPSRRPSIHGSPAALKTTLASADDEILDEEDLLDPQVSPSQVGVIGSRPLISKSAAASLNQRLNPNAPTFMATIFRPKDKETDAIKEKDKSKGKDKEKGKEKNRDRNKATTPSFEHPPILDDSPSDSRISRDTFSVHTQTSISESRESLSLERTFSNTPSDNPSAGAPSSLKEQESAMRKLFRKGSSGKFSFSSRLGKESSLFKKGPGSTTNSDKNISVSGERSSIGDMDEYLGGGEDAAHLGRSYDSVTSSPSLGPSKSKESKEGRMREWSSRFSIKKKPKESLELDRAATESEADEKKDA